MMHNSFLVEQDAEMRLQEARLRAQQHRLLRQALKNRQRRLSRQRCWLLCQLGGFLVGLGQRLQQYGQPQTLRLKTHLNGGGLSGNGE